MRILILCVILSAVLASCWKIYDGKQPDPPARTDKVWGYRAIYGPEAIAKMVLYSPAPRPTMTAGNIYAFQNYIFQLEPGRGIHVIDNTIPSAAHKIGFLTVNGCSQISIKDDKIYTNSYDDLVILDFSDLNNVHEFSRLKGVFTEYRYNSPATEPPAAGYYQCPQPDSFVVSWVKDSVIRSCYKY